MINLTRVKSATSEFIKVLVYGKSDVRTADSVTPAGIDSKPVKDALAIYARTNDTGQPVVLGYLSNSDKTAEGETRLFAEGADEQTRIEIIFKLDGTCEIGGNSDFMVRFSELESAYNQLKDDHDALVEAFNLHVHPTAAVGAPSPPTPVPTKIPATPSTGDISGAKIEEIKTL